MKATLLGVVCALALASCERETGSSATSSPPAPDNTAVNTRDRADDAQTAGSTSQGKSDVELAADIRKRITDTEMSVNAQNAKVVVQGGKVTLRGPVKSQQEKDAIGKFAAEVAGAGNVDNQLEIAP